MEMKELLDGLSSNLGIDSLAIIGGEAAIDIDGMPVLIAEAQTEEEPDFESIAAEVVRKAEAEAAKKQ